MLRCAKPRTFEVPMNGSFFHPLQGYAPLHHFLGLLLVILLAVLQGRVGRSGAFWQICWALPGTVLHVFYRKVIRLSFSRYVAG
jgi:hypothetical protein